VAPWFMVTEREEVPLIHELKPQLVIPMGYCAACAERSSAAKSQ
jgi:hypothetical protein